MNTEKKSCCAQAAAWALIGIVIAVSWGIGNLANGMSPLMAFAVPGLVMFALLSVVALAALDVPWFNRLCACPRDEAKSQAGKKNTKISAGMTHRPAA